MTNERIIYMEGGGGYMDNEAQNFKMKPTERAQPAPVEATEKSASPKPDKLAHPSRQRAMEPVARRDRSVLGAPEGGNFGKSSLEIAMNRANPEETADKPQKNEPEEATAKQESSYIPAPEVKEESLEPEKEKTAEQAEDESERKEEENGEQEEERQFMNELQQLMEEGKEEEVRDRVKEVLPEDAEDKDKKVDTIVSFAEEMSKPKEERDIVKQLQNVGDDEQMNEMMKKSLLQMGYSEDEMKKLYEEAGKPYAAPVGDETEDEGETLPGEAPTGQEVDAEIKSMYDALDEEDYDKAGKKAEDLFKKLKGLEKSKGILKIAALTVYYAAIAAVITYIGLMAKVGNNIKK